MLPNSNKQGQLPSFEQTPSSSSSRGYHRPISNAEGSSDYLSNKCGKCQNHNFQTSKKGHARDCPFSDCKCLRCRLLDARSDILQVISKENRLKGTKKDPNCGFCQNHGEMVLRKGHVRTCHFGQERHFGNNQCFECEVHYIRNEVNRLQIKMRRAMKEDQTLSEEQRKTAREAITREEVDRVCVMAQSAREKRETMIEEQKTAATMASSAHLRNTDQTAARIWRPWSHQHQQVAVDLSGSLFDRSGQDLSIAPRPMPASHQSVNLNCFIESPTQIRVVTNDLSSSNIVSLPQDQPLAQSRELQLFHTLQLFRLMLQFSAQNQSAN